MKKLLLITLCLVGANAWAGNCSKATNSFEIEQCIAESVKSLKVKLNKTYNKIYAQTEAKQQLEAAQKAWITYRDLQCGDFVDADTNHSPASNSISLACQTDLISQRIDYLKSLQE